MKTKEKKTFWTVMEEPGQKRVKTVLREDGTFKVKEKIESKSLKSYSNGGTWLKRAFSLNRR